MKKQTEKVTEKVTILTYSLMFLSKFACVSIYDVVPAMINDNVYRFSKKRKANRLLTHTDRFDDFLRKIYGKNLKYFTTYYLRMNNQIQPHMRAIKDMIKSKYPNAPIYLYDIYIARRIIMAVNKKYKEAPFLTFFNMDKILSELDSIAKTDSLPVHKDIQDAIDIMLSKLTDKRIIHSCLAYKSAGVRYWTLEEIDFLQENYKKRTAKELSLILARPVSQIYNKQN